MKKVLFLFSFLFLFSCLSSEKKITKASSKPENWNNRSVAHLKEVSQFKESSFQFISKKMKEMIQNYERMKEQLEKIEKKIDRSLQKALAKSEPYQPKMKKDNDSINLMNKKGEKVQLSLSKPEDYIQLMADILKGEYKIDEQEKEKLLFRIKNHMDQNKAKEQTAPPEVTEIEDMDKDLQLDEEDVFFEEEEQEIFNEKTDEDALDKPEEDASSFISAKKHFKQKSYETAISEFQKYRNHNPEGVHYPEATFYIGQSFEKLKMPIEAGVFFKEIVQSHPQSLWASRAKQSLKK